VSSYLKYRIKKVSESETSPFDPTNIPESAYADMRDNNYFSPADTNIKPHTCTFITKVFEDGTPRYYCGIKRWTNRYDLIPSDVNINPTGTANMVGGRNLNTPMFQGDFQGRVSGAKKLTSRPIFGAEIADNYFECMYCDSFSAMATKRGLVGDEFVEFPMCNCYTPLGGIAVTSFDGAVKGKSAVGIVHPVQGSRFQDASDVWSNYSSGKWSPTAGFTGPIPPYVTQNLKTKFPASPPYLGMIYMMLNARATVVPCCWWVGAKPIIYEPSMFRVIDLAVAMSYRLQRAGSYPECLEKVSQQLGVSDDAEYSFLTGDFWYPGDIISYPGYSSHTVSQFDAYTLNSLFGRRYDPTLPECGNNQRFIYVLHPAYIFPWNKPLDEDKDNSSCTPVWYSNRNKSPFSARNCGHPECSVKYAWGHVCNGGGAFSLGTGKACPHYMNPLMGDKDTKNKYAKLQNMYAGDSITAAAILELMWLSKGGQPWTQEEWKNTWLVPHIWTTVPFSPVQKFTNKMLDESGASTTTNVWHPEYEIYSRKTTIAPEDGKIELAPMRKLPGGSIVAFKRGQNRSLDDADAPPDVPTTIKKLDVAARGVLKIVWPASDLSLLNVKYSSSSDYVDALKKIRAQAYNRLVWSKNGLRTEVVGQATKAQYPGGIFCVNTAFIYDSEWRGKRELLESNIEEFRTSEDEPQELLRLFWEKINKSYLSGQSPLLVETALLKTSIDNYGLFIFEDVPLSPLESPNKIIIFGIDATGFIDATMVKVNPIIRHGYAYQQSSMLKTGWKAVWNGRPSLFLNEEALNTATAPPVEAGKIVQGIPIKVGTWYFSAVTGDYIPPTRAIQETITALEAEVENLQSALMDTTLSREDRIDKQMQLSQRQSALKEARAQLAQAETDTSQYLITTEKERQTLLDSLTKRVDEVASEILTCQRRIVEATEAGNSGRVTIEQARLTALENEYSILQAKKQEIAGQTITLEDPDTDKAQRSQSTSYSYKDKKKESYKGDPDTNEDGIVQSDQVATTTLSARTPVKRLYVPFLNPDRVQHRDLDKYKSTMFSTGSQVQETINLSIPDDSGLTKWKYFMVPPQREETADTRPVYSFPSGAVKKVVVYSTRNADAGSSASNELKGQKITSSVAKWYRTSGCNSTLILVVNPEICNQNSEFMIFSLTGVLKQPYYDADGAKKFGTKRIQFLPMNYSQVTRPFPGYSPGKSALRIGTESAHGVNYQKIQISEDIEILEKPELPRHPWVFFINPIEDTVVIKEWRYYNNQWYPQIINAIPVAMPDQEDTELELYMEYAYIAEMYDENEAEANYKWKGDFCDTRILFSSPKSGIMKTVFNYTPPTDDKSTIDSYLTAPIGSSTMATVWPYARYACRDYEITYVWQDNYRGEELSTDNMPVGTSTAYAASRTANKITGQNKVFTMADMGDHDLGTEFQPKLRFSNTTTTNATSDAGGYQANTFESSSTFEDQTDQRLKQFSPTYGFPAKAQALCTVFIDRDALGAMYYPYTRAEPGTAYVPKHKTYPWDFLDRWRNKPKKAEDLGIFRMQAFDWCTQGTTIDRVKKWYRHWIYDPRRETKFLGRSKTRGPVFQLEYREYFDLPNKTVILRPYVANTMGQPDQCYCAYCNRYFARDICKGGGPCPLCEQSGGITRKTGWASDWMYLVDRYETDAVVPETEVVTPEESRVGTAVNNPSRVGYETWKEKMKTLYDTWSNKKTSTAMSNLVREQARGRSRGWFANIINGLEFVDDEKTKKNEDDYSRLQSIAEESEIDMITGCDKFGITKRKDLGAFQMVDEYVPDSINPYYGADPNSASEMQYKELEAKARQAESDAEKATANYDRYKSKQEMIGGAGNVYYTEGNVTYASDARAKNDASYTSIDAKVKETEGLKKDAETKAQTLRMEVEVLNKATARGQARTIMNRRAQEMREKVTKHLSRFYEYEQTAYGYNYPWSPYDSPPLFGNMGRELFAVELCTIGSMISWLPKDPNGSLNITLAGVPAVPSWYTSRKPEGQPKELTTLLVPPTECSRAVIPLSAQAINPFYYYQLSDYKFSEQLLKSGDKPDILFPKDLRIVNQSWIEKSGRPETRSDAGRFTLAVVSGSKMDSINIVGENSPSYSSLQDNSMLAITSFATERVPVSYTSKLEPYLEGAGVKGLSVSTNDKLFVGARYPGFSGPYNYGRSHVGFKKYRSHTPFWAWPERNRDKITRAIRLIKWYSDLLPPLPVSLYDRSLTDKELQQIITNWYRNLASETKMFQEAEEGQGLWAMSTIVPAPYVKKPETTDDGREVSCGPALKKNFFDDKAVSETDFWSTSFAIIIESERCDEDGKGRPPLVWVKELDNEDIKDIGIETKVPGPNAVAHRVTKGGSLVPVLIGKGDEDQISIDKIYGKARPLYKNMFSTGPLQDLPGITNPSNGANLITSNQMNEAGYYPGFVVGPLHYRTLGKVFLEKEFPTYWYDRIKVRKTKYAGGPNIHTVQARITIPRFGADAFYIEVELDSVFSSIQSFLPLESDAITLEIRVSGSLIPIIEPSGRSEISLVKKLPLKDNKVKFFLDLGMTYNLNIDFTWIVKTDGGTFDLGPWKTSLETKIVTTMVGGVPTNEVVPNEESFCYLNELIANIKLGVLQPGKCAEIVRVEETGFYVSIGSESELEGEGSYNLYTEPKQDWYKSNWEDFDKKLEKDTGWWKDSGRLSSDDMMQTEEHGGAGVEQNWFVKAEEDMYRKMREEEERTLTNPQGQSKPSTIGKEPKAEIFPKACVEVPEMPISRLKMMVWNALNWGISPNAKEYPFAWEPVRLKNPLGRDSDSWMWGGIWTTRMAGPEWVSADQYPSRDMIWWPALPFGAGKVILKGQYFKFGKQYKDESPLVATAKHRGIEEGDDYNKYAYKYEVRGFDALLKMIQTVEAGLGDEMRSASYVRQYGTQPSYDGTTQTSAYANNQANLARLSSSVNTAFGPQVIGGKTMSSISNPMNLGGFSNSMSDLLGALGGGAGYSASMSRPYAAMMADQSVAGINNSIKSQRNYTVTDQRNWVYLDQLSLKVDSISWEQMQEREGNQEKLFTEALELGKEFRTSLGAGSNSKIEYTARIPYHDWSELEDLTGTTLLNKYKDLVVKGSMKPISKEELDNFCDTSCEAKWAGWTWEEVESFSFRNEFQQRYPLKSQRTGQDWKTILARKCGKKWAHQDREVDGGKIWANESEEFKTSLKLVRQGGKKMHPLIVTIDCTRPTAIPSIGTNLEHFDHSGGATECTDFEQKWKPTSVWDGYPSTVSSDFGQTFNRPDPWWRF
jgi:hypothetical protein